MQTMDYDHKGHTNWCHWFRKQGFHCRDWFWLGKCHNSAQTPKR